MANKSLFQSLKSKFTKPDTSNEAGGLAHQFDAKQALAQIVCTGCFNGTFYADADAQLAKLIELIQLVNDDHYLAKLAIYARQKAFMKDMPVALVAALAGRDPRLFQKTFEQVVDNGRVLRTLFQMIRSGKFGKRSLTGSPQRAFQRWLNKASVEKLLSTSIGTNPSLRDILRLARPTPVDNERRALFGWLTDKEVERWAPATQGDLPTQITLLDAFRRAETSEDQLAILNSGLKARWDLLADTVKGTAVWTAIARTMGPQAIRMNLNTLARHGVFEDPQMVAFVASRLSDADEIKRSGQFPYQYFSAYLNINDEIPHAIKSALSQAAEIACGNIPVMSGPVVIGLDVSGSMASPITGNRGRGATTKMRCVDVAALIAAAILRRNPDSVVIPFDTKAYFVKVDPSDSILSLSQRLAQYGGGGTDCSTPIAYANNDLPRRKFAGVILVSDQESWVYKGRPHAYGSTEETGVMAEWRKFVKSQVRLHGKKFVGPKLVCIDLQPYTTTQAPDCSDILNVGGFSDAVFDVVTSFINDDAGRFVKTIESVSID